MIFNTAFMEAGETVSYAPLTVKFDSGHTGKLIYLAPQDGKLVVTTQYLSSSGTTVSVPVGMPFVAAMDLKSGDSLVRIRFEDASNSSISGQNAFTFWYASGGSSSSSSSINQESPSYPMAVGAIKKAAVIDFWYY